MAKKSKALRAAIEKIDATKLYSVEEAVVKLLVFSFSLKVRKLKKLQQLVQTSLVLMNSLLKSTVDGWTSTLLSQHLI